MKISSRSNASWLNISLKKSNIKAKKIWDEKGWTDDDMDSLEHTHMRTSYKHK